MAKNGTPEERNYIYVNRDSNTIRTNLIKTKIYNRQQNSKCRLGDDRKEKVNYLKSECSKLARKECEIVFIWNPFEMRLLNLRIIFWWGILLR